MKWITFGPQPASTESVFQSILNKSNMGAGELTKAPNQAMTAPPGVPAQKPMSPLVAIGITVGVGSVLFLLLTSMQRQMDQFDRGLR